MALNGANLRGLSILSHKVVIGGLIKRTESQTLLDYGCGGGAAYDPPYELHREWNVERPFLYDPAFPSHDQVPAAVFDGVLCSDVLEHVRIPEIETLVEVLFAHSSRFVWASVCCRAAKKTFPDGTNLHVTIKPYAWWDRVIKRIAGERFYWLTETV